MPKLSGLIGCVLSGNNRAVAVEWMDKVDRMSRRMNSLTSLRLDRVNGVLMSLTNEMLGRILLRFVW